MVHFFQAPHRIENTKFWPVLAIWLFCHKFTHFFDKYFTHIVLHLLIFSSSSSVPSTPHPFCHTTAYFPPSSASSSSSLLPKNYFFTTCCHHSVSEFQIHFSSQRGAIKKYNWIYVFEKSPKIRTFLVFSALKLGGFLKWQQLNSLQSGDGDLRNQQFPHQQSWKYVRSCLKIFFDKNLRSCVSSFCTVQLPPNTKLSKTDTGQKQR